MSNDRNLNLEDFTQDIENPFAQMGSMQLSALEEFREFQILSQVLFQQEAERLKQKLGSDHPQVRQMETRLQQHLDLIQDLEVQVEVARIRVPEVNEKDALIQGRIIDRNKRGISGLTVYGEDENKRELRAVGRAETDVSGHYALPIKAASVIELNRGHREGIFLAVRMRSGQVVYRWPDPVGIAESCRLEVNLSLNRDTLVPLYVGSRPVDEQPIDNPIPQQDRWIAKGRVTDANGRGLEGLTISLYDRDLIFDDRLGTTKTNNQGYFQIAYSTRDFRDLIEANPDLYLKVFDSQGNQIHTLETPVRFQPGHAEEFDVQLGDA